MPSTVLPFIVQVILSFVPDSCPVRLASAILIILLDTPVIFPADKFASVSVTAETYH